MGRLGKHGRGGSLHQLRGALARRFLIRIKRATHRAPPRLINPAAKRALVIAPHMDDEVISCGGTLLLLMGQGAEVHVIYATDSSGPERATEAAEQRRSEAEHVRNFMQFTSAIELGYPDGQLHRSEAALAGDVGRELERLQPDLVLCPFPADAHSDHMSCASSVAAAAAQAQWNGVILAYEVWTPLWPNVAVDISSVADRKEHAIRLYASQVADRDYADAALGFNRFRGLIHSVQFAEAFFQCTPAEFSRLTTVLNSF